MSMANGRTARILTYLVQQGRPRTLRQILDATAPAETSHVTNSALQQMTRRGYVAKDGHGKGNVTYRAGTVSPRRARLADNAKAPTPPAQPIGHLQVVPRNAPHARTHFHLAPAATSIPEIAQANSARIAADIAAFEARGGRVERLGPTQFFKPAPAGNDE